MSGCFPQSAGRLRPRALEQIRAPADTRSYGPRQASIPSCAGSLGVGARRRRGRRTRRREPDRPQPRRPALRRVADPGRATATPGSGLQPRRDLVRRRGPATARRRRGPCAACAGGRRAAAPACAPLAAAPVRVDLRRADARLTAATLDARARRARSAIATPTATASPTRSKRPPGSNPRSADSDGDGLPDGWERQHNLDPVQRAGRRPPTPMATASATPPSSRRARTRALATPTATGASDGERRLRRRRPEQRGRAGPLARSQERQLDRQRDLRRVRGLRRRRHPQRGRGQHSAPIPRVADTDGDGVPDGQADSRRRRPHQRRGGRAAPRSRERRVEPRPARRGARQRRRRPLQRHRAAHGQQPVGGRLRRQRRRRRQSRTPTATAPRAPRRSPRAATRWSPTRPRRPPPAEAPSPAARDVRRRARAHAATPDAAGADPAPARPPALRPARTPRPHPPRQPGSGARARSGLDSGLQRRRRPDQRRPPRLRRPRRRAQPAARRAPGRRSRTRRTGAPPVDVAGRRRLARPSGPYDPRSMRIGIITGSGTYALPELEAGAPGRVATPFGDALVSEGRFAQADVAARRAPRRGAPAPEQRGHPPGQHLGAARARGAGDPGRHGVRVARPRARARHADRLRRPALPGQPPARRLAVHAAHRARRARARALDLRPCRSASRCAARCSTAPREAGCAVRDGGCYGHVDGPRFNTQTEIRMLMRRRRHRGLADRRARDRPRRRGQAALRAARLRDRLRQRRQARGADARRGARPPRRGQHRDLRAHARRPRCRA